MPVDRLGEVALVDKELAPVLSIQLGGDRAVYSGSMMIAATYLSMVYFLT